MYKERVRESFDVIKTLLIVYLVIYFGVAVLTSREMVAFSSPVVAGMPVGVWLGLAVIIVSQVVTSLYLKKWLKRGDLPAEKSKKVPGNFSRP